MRAFALEVIRDLAKALLIGAAMAGLAASGIFYWLSATPSGQAVTATVELVQSITVEVQQTNGGLTDTLRRINESLELAVRFFEKELAQ